MCSILFGLQMDFRPVVVLIVASALCASTRGNESGTAKIYLGAAERLEVNHNSIPNIISETGSDTLMRALCGALRSGEELLRQKTLPQIKIEFADQSKTHHVDHLSLTVQGVNPELASDLAKMAKLFVSSRLVGLSYELSVDRALLQSSKPMFTENTERDVERRIIADKYLLPFGCILDAPQLGWELGLSEDRHTKDFVVMDGALVLWFTFESPIPELAMCIPLDRRFITRGALNGFCRVHRDQINTRLAEIQNELGISGRSDVGIVSSELKLYWQAVSDVCRSVLRQDTFGAHNAPDFEVELEISRHE